MIKRSGTTALGVMANAVKPPSLFSIQKQENGDGTRFSQRYRGVAFTLPHGRRYWS